MPVRNCGNTLALTLRSLQKQTFSDWELFLVDDGSTDETLSVAYGFTDPRIKILSDGNQRGLPARINQVIDTAISPYLARMDGDDIAYPERLERQLAYHQMHPDVDLVGTWVVVFDAAGKVIGKRTGGESHAEICVKPYAGFPMAHPTYMGKLDWFRRYRYNESALISQDQELLFRAYRFSRFANVPQILLGYREEAINLKKNLAGRRIFANLAARAFWREKRPVLAARAVTGHILRGALDCFAIGTGLNYRVLQHRAVEVSDAEQRDWEHVWQSVNEFNRR